MLVDALANSGEGDVLLLPFEVDQLRSFRSAATASGNVAMLTVSWCHGGKMPNSSSFVSES